MLHKIKDNRTISAVFLSSYLLNWSIAHISSAQLYCVIFEYLFYMNGSQRIFKSNTSCHRYAAFFISSVSLGNKIAQICFAVILEPLRSTKTASNSFIFFRLKGRISSLWNFVSRRIISHYWNDKLCFFIPFHIFIFMCCKSVAEVFSQNIKCPKALCFQGFPSTCKPVCIIPTQSYQSVWESDPAIRGWYPLPHGWYDR